MAKRRLLYTLAALGLDVPSRKDDPESGLAFEFLEDGGDGERVMTGHDNGLITLNIAEAEDAYREKVRSAMGEPYRTLLGHFTTTSASWSRTTRAGSSPTASCSATSVPITAKR